MTRSEPTTHVNQLLGVKAASAMLGELPVLGTYHQVTLEMVKETHFFL